MFITKMKKNFLTPPPLNLEREAERGGVETCSLQAEGMLSGGCCSGQDENYNACHERETHMRTLGSNWRKMSGIEEKEEKEDWKGHKGKGR